MNIQEMKIAKSRLTSTLVMKNQKLINLRLDTLRTRNIFKDAQAQYKKLDRKIFILEGRVNKIPTRKPKALPKIKHESKVEEYVKKLPATGQEEMLKRLLELREERKLAKNSE